MNGKRDADTGGTVYLRYSREERLKRAPESVRRMYEPDYIMRQGILKGLTATRASRAILFSIVVSSLILIFSFFASSSRTSGKIQGIPVRLETFKQNGFLYVNVLFSDTDRPEGLEIPLTVYAAVSDQEGHTQSQKSVASVYIGTAITIPFQFEAEHAAQLDAMIHTETGQLHLTKAVQSR